MKKDKFTKTLTWESFRELGNPENEVLPEEEKQDSSPNPDMQKPIRVYLERKGRGGKKVTIIKGLYLSDVTGESLLKEMKIKMGIGGTIKENEIILQGDHRHKAIAELQLKGYTNVKNAGS